MTVNFFALPSRYFYVYCTNSSVCFIANLSSSQGRGSAHSPPSYLGQNDVPELSTFVCRTVVVSTFWYCARSRYYLRPYVGRNFLGKMCHLAKICDPLSHVLESNFVCFVYLYVPRLHFHLTSYLCSLCYATV